MKAISNERLVIDMAAIAIYEIILMIIDGLIINKAIKAAERSKMVAPISAIIHDNVSVNSEFGTMILTLSTHCRLQVKLSRFIVYIQFTFLIAFCLYSVAV